MSKCCALAFHQNFATLSDIGKSSVLQSLAVSNDLEQCVNQNGLCGKRTVGILGQSDYQLLRINRPDAQVREMVSAILWQEQARFSLPIDQLFIDYLDCPSVTNSPIIKERQLYVVAVAKRTLRERYQTLLNASLQPIKITLPEFIYAQYVSKRYAAEPLVIWVNHFQDASQVFAFYQRELVATLKLPKIEATTMSEACMTALNLFYLAEVKPFSASPLWLMNGAFSIEASMLSQFSGRVQWLKDEPNATPYFKALEHYNHSTISHAYYGMACYDRIGNE